MPPHLPSSVSTPAAIPQLSYAGKRETRPPGPRRADGGGRTEAFPAPGQRTRLLHRARDGELWGCLGADLSEEAGDRLAPG